MTYDSKVLLKRKPQAPIALLVLKPVLSNLDLIPDLTSVSTSPRNLILVNQSEISRSRANKVICHMGPLHSQRKKRQLA